MLSYRHAFHAGNFADVLKHAVQVALLAHLGRKPKPFWVIDTHAGAGVYALEDAYAMKNAEWAAGIGALWERPDAPPLVAALVDLVRDLNPDGALRYYPGSPWLSRQLTRPGDHLRLFERHPADHALLAENLRDPRVHVARGDGFAGLRAVLPPPPRRGLVLVDPPYEEKQDYGRVVEALEHALGRFAGGVYALWYPCLPRPEAASLPARLEALPAASWLRVELHVAAPAAGGRGMHGSGLFVLNPPFTLEASLRESLPWLVDALGRAPGARFVLEARAP